MTEQKQLFKWTREANQVYRDALRLREVVFIEEQAVPRELEIDQDEDKAHHCVLYLGQEPVATGRLLIHANYGKLQRIAVAKPYRGQQLGQALLSEMERYAKQLGLKQLKMGAQNQAIPFYEKLGYTICSDEFLDAGIKHHMMAKNL